MQAVLCARAVDARVSVIHALGPRIARWAGLLGLSLGIGLGFGGCAHTPGAGSKTPWIAPTSTNQWNEYTNDLITRNASGQVGALRSLAYVNVAIHNAMVQAGKEQKSADGAAAGAAATVLAQLFPRDEAATTARLQREVQAIGAPQRAAFQAGVDLGRQVGEQVLAMARADRIAAPWTGSVPVGEGKWASLVQPAAPPLAPALGGARTFVLDSGAEFRAPPPPAYGSPEFQRQVKEVRSVSDARTNEQVRVAQFWENLNGAFAAGTWNQVARAAMAAQGLDEATTARNLAVMHVAGFDGVVACHDAKYTYWVPRPTQVDSGITLAVGVPNHPSYPSNHSCISGAIGWVLDALLPGSNGQYTAMGLEAGQSRLYGGIHYPMDMEAGNAIAAKVAAKALQFGPAPGQTFTPRGR
jgi:hypothetical protein